MLGGFVIKGRKIVVSRETLVAAEKHSRLTTDDSRFFLSSPTYEQERNCNEWHQANGFFAPG